MFLIIMSHQKSTKAKEYSNGEITVVWKPALCIHSTNCVKGLPEVFNNHARPWINAGGAGSERIVAQVEKCPSGALSYFRNSDSAAGQDTASPDGALIEVTAAGPLVVQGPVRIRLADGSEETKDGKVALCRCGSSGRKPFCDGSHRRVNFQG